MTDSLIECPECGWRQPDFQRHCLRCKTLLRSPDSDDRGKPALWSRLRALLFAVPDSVNIVEFAGRAITLALIGYMGIWALTLPIEDGAVVASNMHYIHLVFHEAGHMLFRFFGEFMATAGGTLMQVLMPALILAAFLGKENRFGAAVALWWIGHSFLDIAPYAYDARAQELMLLGGVTGRDVPGYHDWNNMLSQLGWLAHDHSIARFFQAAGAGLITAALAWAGYLLWRQYTRLERL